MIHTLQMSEPVKGIMDVVRWSSTAETQGWGSRVNAGGKLNDKGHRGAVYIPQPHPDVTARSSPSSNLNLHRQPGAQFIPQGHVCRICPQLEMIEKTRGTKGPANIISRQASLSIAVSFAPGLPQPSYVNKPQVCRARTWIKGLSCSTSKSFATYRIPLPETQTAIAFISSTCMSPRANQETPGTKKRQKQAKGHP